MSVRVLVVHDFLEELESASAALQKAGFRVFTNTDPLAAHGTVSVVDVGKHAVTATLDVGKAPKRIHLVELPPPPGY